MSNSYDSEWEKYYKTRPFVKMIKNNKIPYATKAIYDKITRIAKKTAGQINIKDCLISA